jgi:hypothetical protein
MMMMLARVVALLIVEGGVGGDGDGEECDVTITQKRHMMERSQQNLLSICCQICFCLSFVFLICFCLLFTFSNSIW